MPGVGIDVELRDEQLPQAVIALKQGVGRLIRSDADRGVLVLCDPRLISRGYGRRILQSLPPMRFTRSAAEAVGFFSELARTRSSARPATAPPARSRK